MIIPALIGFTVGFVAGTAVRMCWDVWTQPGLAEMYS